MSSEKEKVAGQHTVVQTYMSEPETQNEKKLQKKLKSMNECGCFTVIRRDWCLFSFVLEEQQCLVLRLYVKAVLQP